MDIYCYHCDSIFNRDKKINGKVVDEYVNLYGTMCPNCGKVVKPMDKNPYERNAEETLEKMRIIMREKLKEKFGDKKCL